MLSKIWKKLALAICIIAILFNITNKLVNRTNLGTQLKSVIGGTSISEFFNNVEDSLNGSDNTIVDRTNNGKNSVKITVKAK